VGIEVDEPVWNHVVSSKNRERLRNEEIAGQFFARGLSQATPDLRDERFTVDDDRLIEARASQ
jgi:hypothetical protein